MKINYIIPLLMLLVACGGKEDVKTTESAPAVESMKVTLTSAQVKNAGLTFSKLEEKEMKLFFNLLTKKMEEKLRKIKS